MDELKTLEAEVNHELKHPTDTTDLGYWELISSKLPLALAQAEGVRVWMQAREKHRELEHTHAQQEAEEMEDADAWEELIPGRVDEANEGQYSPLLEPYAEDEEMGEDDLPGCWSPQLVPYEELVNADLTDPREDMKRRDDMRTLVAEREKDRRLALRRAALENAEDDSSFRAFKAGLLDPANPFAGLNAFDQFISSDKKRHAPDEQIMASSADMALQSLYMTD
eukprot:GHVU01002851.1.p1 GENE.GHVU01002851.1~~GHVU01002851.1.p1  ORF type:complete len:224 (-),score=70.10 GHVU01002851.1:543-1214(-)